MSKNKQKTHSGTKKRVKVTGTGKIRRRHQLAKGHLRSKKSKKKVHEYRNKQKFSDSAEDMVKKLIGMK